MRRTIILAAACVIALDAAGVQAGTLGRPCTSAAESQYLTQDQLQGKAEAQGYKVTRVKVANACGEIYALDKDGAKVELFVDPTNGNIIGKN